MGDCCRHCLFHKSFGHYHLVLWQISHWTNTSHSRLKELFCSYVSLSTWICEPGLFWCSVWSTWQFHLNQSWYTYLQSCSWFFNCKHFQILVQLRYLSQAHWMPSPQTDLSPYTGSGPDVIPKKVWIPIPVVKETQWTDQSYEAPESCLFFSDWKVLNQSKIQNQF